MPRTLGAKELSDFTRGRIIGQWEAGKSQRSVAATLGIPLSTVNNIVFQFSHHGKVSVEARSGRPKPSNRLLRSIKRSVECNHRITAAQVAESSAVSVATARRHLKKLGYNGRAARRKPLLSAKNVVNRLSWAREMRCKSLNFWEHVIFSDESSFHQMSTGGRVWVWRRSDQAFDLNCLQPTVKHSFSVMVWGAIWFNGRSKLIHCQGSVTSIVYHNILQQGLLPIYTAGDISKQETLFMQDNAPVHTAKTTKAWLQQEGISCLRWPAQSPDMNPIEHAWSMLDKAMQKRPNKPTSATNLLTILQEEWAAIPQVTFNKLIHSMPKRVSDVYHAKGKSTRY